MSSNLRKKSLQSHPYSNELIFFLQKLNLESRNRVEKFRQKKKPFLINNLHWINSYGNQIIISHKNWNKNCVPTENSSRFRVLCHSFAFPFLIIETFFMVITHNLLIIMIQTNQCGDNLWTLVWLKTHKILCKFIFREICVRQNVYE